MPNTDINMKDHDILIATYTLQQELVRRFDEYIKLNDEKHQTTATELGAMGRNQVRIEGQITSMKGMWNSLDERVDKVENSNRWFNAAAIIGAIIAGVFAWIK